MKPASPLVPRRTVLAALALAGSASSLRAQGSYPEARPIRIVVPFPPGGSVDPIARIIGQKLNEMLGATIVVDNRAGANSALGAGYVAKAPADGHTLLFTAATTHVIHTLQSKQPYDSLKDFAAVATVSRSPYMLAVNPSVPAKTLPELIAHAKANPGKLNYGSSGVGNANHLAGELFNLLAGVQVVHVPYKGGGPALQDLLAGRVQMMVTNESLLQPQVDAGTLRALAYTSQRTGSTPVPTFAQYGMPDFERMESLNVMLAPAGTPEPVIAKLASTIQRALAMPDVKATIEAQKAAAFYQSPAELGERLRGDRAKFVEVIDKAKIQLTP